MDDLRGLLSDEKLRALREGYDARATGTATSSPFAEVYPPLHLWVSQTAATFFGPESTLVPRDRERCVIALLAASGVTMSLAIHIYWGLMEGLSVDEICQTIALSGVYGGVQRVAEGFLVLQRALECLSSAVDLGSVGSQVVLTAIVAAFR
jgi:alkylhydroperoxidase/carboxymuconolactone decarboxylase family protein YurZ